MKIASTMRRWEPNPWQRRVLAYTVLYGYEDAAKRLDRSTSRIAQVLATMRYQARVTSTAQLVYVATARGFLVIPVLDDE